MIQTKASRPLNTDKLAMVDRDKAIMEAHRALDAIQNLEPELQVAAVNILFAAYMTRTRLLPQTSYMMGKRLLEDAQFNRQANASVRSMLDFVGLRVVGDAGTTIS